MLRLGMLMDPIGSINIKKDSSFAMLLAAQKPAAGNCYTWNSQDLFLRDGRVYAHLRRLRVKDDPAGWFELEAPHTEALDRLDILLMRKDPPFDMELRLHHATCWNSAEAAGYWWSTDPPACATATRSSSPPGSRSAARRPWSPASAARLREFLAEQDDIILKPLDGMGGASIFRVRSGDPNTGVILETLTEHGSASPWHSASSRRSAPATSAS
jgi:glutathione synthase